jgi:hypothetical protein
MGLAETYQEFENRNLDCIEDCSKEVGLMIKIKTTFKNDVTIGQLADYFISVNSYEMEDLYAELQRYHSIRKELS